MNLNLTHKQRAFTLVEVLVVMLIVVALASVTLDFTKDFAFQGRYEVTKDRYEKLKRAIIGQPDVLINGQPDISGFVADMGRLPRNIQELLVQNYCMPDYTISDNTIDGRPVAYTTNKDWCIGTYTAATVKWVEQTAWVAQTATSLEYGWKGPYLTIQKPDFELDAFSDGWGNIATANTDHNYGWKFVHKDSSNSVIATINTNLASIGDATTLDIQSLGKNQASGGSGYNEDYPVSQPSLDNLDWLIDISSGLNVEFKIPKKPGLCHFLSSQSPSGAIDASECFNNISPGAWGICRITTHTTKSACETNNLFWSHELSWCVDFSQQNSTNNSAADCGYTSTGSDPSEKWGVCVDTSKTSSVNCTGTNDVWWADKGWCINKSETAGTCTTGTTHQKDFCHSDDSTCQVTGGDWENCAFDADSCPSGSSWLEKCKLTVNSCEKVANGTWDYAKGNCKLSNQSTCVSAGGTWAASTCSINSDAVNSIDNCQAIGGAMIGVCDNSSNCSGANTWIGSANYCKFTTANCSGNFSTSGMCRRSHTDKTSAILSEKSCIDNGGQKWTENTKQICMNVFFRNPLNSATSYISSEPVNITEDGGYQSVHFSFVGSTQASCEGNNGVWDTVALVCSYPIGVGANAIGIYEYDGNCNSTNSLYPDNKPQIMKVLLAPHNNTPSISW